MSATTQRIAKLRALGDPARNPNEHEAAAARAEADRLEREAPKPKARLSWADVAGAGGKATFERLYHDMMVQQREDDARIVGDATHRFYERMVANAHCYVCGVKLSPEWARAVSLSRCRPHVPALFPDDEGYNAWASALQVGARVEVRHSGSPLIVGKLDPPTFVTIVRLTPTQYVMDDGTRYRRSRPHPGYRVGEDGRSGRHFVCKVN
jgi:hypothetical protein